MYRPCFMRYKQLPGSHKEEISSACACEAAIEKRSPPDALSLHRGSPGYPQPLIRESEFYRCYDLCCKVKLLETELHVAASDQRRPPVPAPIDGASWGSPLTQQTDVLHTPQTQHKHCLPRNVVVFHELPMIMGPLWLRIGRPQKTEAGLKQHGPIV